MADFATVADLAVAWRPLTDDEATRATYWLERASRRIRRRWPDADARITGATLNPLDVRDVVVDLVLEALDGPPVRGARSWSEGSGSENRSVTLATDRGSDELWWPWMVEVFEGRHNPVPLAAFPRAGRYEAMAWEWPEDC
jgi:hypothetical protein